MTGALIGNDTGPFPGTTYSLITVTDPNVLLWALKPAEEGIGRGVIARLWNVSDAPATATLTFTPGLSAAQRTTHIETDLAPVALAGTDAISAAFARQQILTYRLLTPQPSKP